MSSIDKEETPAASELDRDSEPGEAAPTPETRRRAPAAKPGLARVVLALLVAAAVHALAFQPSASGTTTLWWWLLGGYGALSLVALHYYWTEGILAQRLAPRAGDLSIGVLLFGVLLLASFVARSALAPSDSVRYAWLYRLYLQLGDPEVVQHSLSLTSVVLLVAIFEELVWRGLVLDILATRLGSRRGWIVSVLLYAAATLPTAYLLRDPVAGLNPLLPIAAIGAGLVWSFVAARLGRLAPVMVSHMAFSYFSVVQFRWPGM